MKRKIFLSIIIILCLILGAFICVKVVSKIQYKNRIAEVNADAVEIEKKWLIDVDNIKYDLSKAKVYRIEQTYINFNPEIRVRRVNGNQYSFTLKRNMSKDGLIRDEIDFLITEDEYKELVSKQVGNTIYKTRYKLLDNGMVMTIDVFEKDLEGLAYLEIEFASKEEAESYETPDWVIREVTNDIRYKNASLAQNGIPEESSKEGDIGKKATKLYGSTYCRKDHSTEIGGCALTGWTCKLCGRSDTNPDTNVPEICNTCANKTGRCPQCGKKLKNSSLKWDIINISDYGFYEDCNMNIDLDGDGNEEYVEIKSSGKYIIIDGNKYIANSRADEYSDVNQYHICDLNKDNVQEIIHRTFSNMVSPITSYYTIYNFYNNELHEVGKTHLMGNMPNEIYVKDNTIKFEYWPYESPDDYREEIVIDLKLDYISSRNKYNNLILTEYDRTSKLEDNIEWSYKIDLSKKECTKFCSSTGMLIDEKLIEEYGYNKTKTRTLSEEEFNTIIQIISEPDNYEQEESKKTGYMIYNEEGVLLYVSADDINSDILESITQGY